MRKSIQSKLRAAVSFFLLIVSSIQVAFAQGDLSTAPFRIYELINTRRYPEAIALGENAVALADRNLKKTDELRVQIIAALADAEVRSGNSAGAVAFLEREIKSFEADGIKNAGLAFLYQKLASPYGFLGRNIDAEISASHAVELLDSLLPPDDPRIGQALYTLSVQQSVMRKSDDEFHSLRRCIKILTKDQSPSSVSALKLAFLAIADLYDQAGDSTKASLYRDKGLAISTTSLGAFAPPDDFTEASEQALAARNRGDLGAAQTLYEREVGIAVLRFGDESPITETARQSLALVYLQRHERELAKPLMYRMVDSVYRDYRLYFALMTEQERLQFTTSVETTLGTFCSYVNEFHETDPELIGKMYDLALWSNGAVLASTKSIENKLRSSKDPKLQSLSAKLETLRQQYRVSSSSTVPTTIELRYQLNTVEREIVEYLGLPNSNPVSWKDVKRNLDGDEAAIEFLRFTDAQLKSRYTALVIRSQWASPKYVDLGDAAAVENLQFHRYALYATARVEPRDPHFDLWNRVDASLGSGVHRIYLSPDGILNNISFAIIPDSDGRLLADKYDLRYVSSGAILKANGSARRDSGTAILIGNPNFSLSHSMLQRSEVIDTVGSTLNIDVPSAVSWAPLPGTGPQIESVKNTLARNHWQVQVLIRDDATKGLVLKSSVRPRLLHFATHGYFTGGGESSGQIVNSRTDLAMLKSGLVLAGANATDSKASDSLLSSYEISSLDLSGTELVVLSACDTGLGDTLSGGEVFGLRRAFQIAGAKSVLMSMWNVPAEQTNELVEEFYSNWLAGADPHDALRNAQASARSKNEQPVFWGSFILID